MLAGQAARPRGQEQPRLGTLDDAVVVGRGERDHLADAELGQRRSGSVGLEPGGVAERPDADDRPLAGHEPGHRLDGAERAGVGERHRGPGEVVGAGLARVDLADEVLVGEDERAEVERVGVLDAGHDQGARAVGLARRRRRAPGRRARGARRRACPCRRASSTKVALSAGTACRRLDDGVADEVGEADLGPGRAGQLVVEDLRG